MSMKNPLTPAGIEPATFRFVAQHLNHCATAVPEGEGSKEYITMCKCEISGFGHGAVFEFRSSGTFRSICWY